MKSFRDETTDFEPQFNAQGLIPAIAQDIRDGQVKMMAWMNADALRATLESGYVHYWSRSRNQLWKQGESSGHTQKLISIRIDCDQDCLLLEIEQNGAACHTNRDTCFYRTLKSLDTLTFLDKNK